MKQLVATFFISLVLLCAIASCKKDQIAEPDPGYNYFPNQVGRYITYDVDSFFYENAIKTDTFKFQLKEKIQSIYPDNQNRPTLRLERYVKYYNDTVPYSAMTWKLRNVWAENRTTTTAEKVEENVRFVKLIFPVVKGKSWNGNAQNINGEIDYDYSFVDLQKNIAGINFDSTLEVEQQNHIDLIAQQYYVEQYAKNVGLVYKKVIDIQSQPDPSWT
ncbi:MAG: hypothetical protein ACXVPY_16055, partial [Bacteroidia bacterium]